MWTAAYLVHWRRVRWQAGARWFLQHLLDGDPASNNLSWQWVASTFSHKPYFFNRENLERYTKAVYCRDCPLYGQCDFEGTYEYLEGKLFPHGEKVDRSGGSKSWNRPKKDRRN
jgi:deoxyribodipyrimidine photo-lyase